MLKSTSERMTDDPVSENSQLAPKAPALTKFVEAAPEPAGDEPQTPSPIRVFLNNRGSGAIPDGIFSSLMVICACSIFAIVIFIASILIARSKLSLAAFGL